MAAPKLGAAIIEFSGGLQAAILEKYLPNFCSFLTCKCLYKGMNRQGRMYKPQRAEEKRNREGEACKEK